MNLILLGPPGAGKGTVSAQLTQTMGIPQISTGDMFRKHLREETALGIEANGYIEKGELVPDHVVIRMVEERLKDADCQNGYILDGFPRTVAQAEALNHFAKIDYVIDLEVDHDVVLKRLAGRRVCTKCNGTFHIAILSDPGICPDCKEPLVQRKDDSEETIRTRLEVYARQTAPLIEYYERSGLLRPIDADHTINENVQAILKAIGQ